MHRRRVRVRYHEVLLQAVPRPCHRALDVGCGEGEFACLVAQRATRVDALDRVQPRRFPADVPNLSFIEADFMTAALGEQTYDFVSAMASLHHLPMVQALEKLKRLLKPGGVLAIVGLFRAATLRDYALSAVAFPAHWSCREPPMRAPMRDPEHTLAEIRASLERTLPGVRFRRHLRWRYSAVWRSSGRGTSSTTEGLAPPPSGKSQSFP